MKRCTRIVVSAMFAMILLPVVASAGDTYLGDATIYSGSSQYLKPNVLFIIDNNSTMSTAASSASYDKNTVYSGSYETYGVYKLTGQANYVLHISNSDSNLDNVSCSQAKSALQNFSTYTGGGSAALKSDGSCGNGGAGTTYLGNLLNYNVSTTSGTETQIEIIRQAVTNVVGGARYGVKFGFMVFGSNNKGGNLVMPVADVSSTTVFETFKSKLPNTPTTGVALLSGESRPLAESLRDAHFYFDQARSSNTLPISGDSTIHDGSAIPASPVQYSCQKNFVIIITNGDTIGDSDNKLCKLLKPSNYTEGGSNNGGDYDGDGNTGDRCVANSYGNGTHLLDDMAKLAYDFDLSSTLLGIQNIVTHTVQVFSPQKDLLVATALDGHGDYKRASSANELSDALSKVMSNIVAEVDTAFVAPVVPTNPENRTYSGYRLYLGFFYPQTQKPWHGNLKKYGLDGQLRVVDKNGAVATDASGNFLNSAVSYWGNSADGGAVELGGIGARLLADWSFASDDNPRNIYTYLDSSHGVSTANADLTAGQNSFKKTNAYLTAAVLGNTSDRDALIDYMHGLDKYDADDDANTTEKRGWMMGDILHSRPQVVNYNSYVFNATNEGNCPDNWSTAYTDRNKTVIFAGSNDGMMHAFRDCDGKELWAFVPPDILPDLKGLSESAHSYFVDAPPTVFTYDADNDGNIESGDKVILYFGLHRGGSAFYALDVTNPLAPTYLWKIGQGDLGELGQSWSQPNLGVVKFDDNGTIKDMIVAFAGAGYDNANEDRRFGHTQYFTGDNDVPPANSEGLVTSTGTSVTGVTPGPKGRGVFAFEVATLNSGVPTIRTGSPNIIWKFTRGEATSTAAAVAANQALLDFPIPSDITVLDTDYDGYTDRLYVGDTGGQLWRISKHKPEVSPYDVEATNGGPLADPLINNWFGKRIFKANAGGNTANNGRKFFYRPSVSYESNYIGLYIGTGDRAHPLNRDVVDRIYAVYDRGQRTYIAEGNMVDVTSDPLQVATPPADPVTCSSDPYNAQYNAIKCLYERLYSTSNYGWYIGFDTTYGALAGEKVLAAPLVFNKVAYFTTYAPNINNPDPCVGNLGTSRVWALEYKTGKAAFNFYAANDVGGADYVSTTNQESVDGEVVKNYQDRFKTLGVGIPSGLVPVISSSGDADVIIGSGGGVAKAAVDPGGTIIPIYWMQW